jgi:hypothetical protein
MPRKPKPEPDNPEQFKRFVEEARKIGTEADPEIFDRVLGKVARSSRRPVPTSPNLGKVLIKPYLRPELASPKLDLIRRHSRLQQQISRGHLGGDR